MTINEFIQDNKDGIDRYIDGELNEIADCFYNFAHGFWNLSEIGYPEKHLKDIITDEYNQDEGILKKYYERIYKLEEKLSNIEAEYNKNDDSFDENESNVQHLKTEYQDLIHDFSKKMFVYGVKFGSRLQRKL